MSQINDLKTKIQDLINQEVEKNNQQKQRLNFLFSKINEVKELEMLLSIQRSKPLERLKSYENGKFLKAYLLYKSISRANYQPELLEITELEDGEHSPNSLNKGLEKCLKMIEKDLAANQPKEKEPKFEPTNKQLLTILGERIAGNEIERKYLTSEELYHIQKTWDSGFPYLGVWDNKTGKRIIRVCLSTGKIEPDPAEEFLKKHGLNKEKN